MKKLFAFFAALLTATSAFAEDIGLPKDWAYGFQPKIGSDIYTRMQDFHSFVFAIACVVVVVVVGIMAYIGLRFNAKRNPNPSKTTHNTLLEIIWTTIPLLVVVVIMVPSVRLLYYVDKTEKADLTLKVVGYQWYWGYEYPEYNIKPFESRIVPKDKLEDKSKFMLEVDEPVILPVGKTVRVLLTGDPNGVIHAWGVPALGFKRDTNPGHIAEGWIKIEKEGVYYGECYELCGPDHSLMPIKVVGVSQAEFEKWVISKGGSLPSAAPAIAPVVAPTATIIPAPEIKTEQKI
jgi:cytochrome c oxidase subunit 2